MLIGLDTDFELGVKENSGMDAAGLGDLRESRLANNAITWG